MTCFSFSCFCWLYLEPILGQSTLVGLFVNFCFISVLIFYQFDYLLFGYVCIKKEIQSSGTTDMYYVLIVAIPLGH